MTQMKNIKRHIFLLLLAVSVFVNSQAQVKVHLFPDRSSCVSGDTLWFSTLIIPDGDAETGNVVHVQLDNSVNRHITNVSVACTDNQGQGYLLVPDSLSTGIYFLKAFVSGPEKDGTNVINQRLLTVYNRFGEDINSVNSPETNSSETFDQFNGMVIAAPDKTIGMRENVSIKIKIPEDRQSEIKTLIVTAGLADPFSEKNFPVFFPEKGTDTGSLSIPEKNGILLDGVVVAPDTKTPVSGAIVLLSIPDDSISYFDYCISDSAGIFRFYLRNAVGTGNLVIQARSQQYPVCNIKLLENYIETKDPSGVENILLSYDQKKYAETVINASYFNRLFNRYSLPPAKKLSVPAEFNFPFYGEPTATVYPGLFIDLPDFTEISRELLHGVQYRERKDGITMRVYNYGGSEIFTDEPLKLLDGIPVFDSHVFSKMGTTDIRKVDEVFYERFIGDLSFQGVVAVYTRKQSLSWIENTPGISLFGYSCLQPSKKWNLTARQNDKPNLPDFRKVFYRNRITKVLPENEISFQTSDLKGKLSVQVIAITRKNQVLYSCKQIEIK